MRNYEMDNQPFTDLGSTFNHNITDAIKSLDDSVIGALLHSTVVFTNNDPANPAAAVAGATGSDIFSRLELLDGQETRQAYDSRGTNLAAYFFCGFPLLQNADLPGPIAAGGGQQTVESYFFFPLGVRDALRALDFCVTPSMLKQWIFRLTVAPLSELYSGASPVVISGNVQSSVVGIPAGDGVRLGAIPVIKESDYNVVAGQKPYNLGSGRLQGILMEAGNKTFGRIEVKVNGQGWGSQDEIEHFQLLGRQLRRRETETGIDGTTLDGAFAYENLNYWFVPCAQFDRKFGKIPNGDWSLAMNLTALGGDTGISIMTGFAEFPADNPIKSADYIRTMAKRHGVNKSDLVLIPEVDNMRAVPVTGTGGSSPIPVKIVTREKAVRIQRAARELPKVVQGIGPAGGAL